MLKTMTHVCIVSRNFRLGTELSHALFDALNRFEIRRSANFGKCFKNTSHNEEYTRVIVHELSSGVVLVLVRLTVFELQRV